MEIRKERSKNGINGISRFFDININSRAEKIASTVVMNPTIGNVENDIEIIIYMSPLKKINFFIVMNATAFNKQYGNMKIKEFESAEEKSTFLVEMIDRKLIIKVINITGSGIQFLLMSK